MPSDEILPGLPYEEEGQKHFFTFARCLVIPSASGPMGLEEAMLDYENRGVEPFQRDFFRDVAPSLEVVRIGGMPPCRRFWMERTKKGSKDNDLAICILWLMSFPKRPVFCQIVAADQEQAGIVKRRAEEILYYNEWLRPFVRILRNKIVSTNGLAETVIEASDKASAHGETPALLVLNELVHVAKWEVMQAHYNNALGVPRGVVIVSTNAGYKGTKAEKWKNNALSKKGMWHVHVWDKKAPWLNDEDVREAKDVNTRSEFIRLFGREGGGDNWVSGKGDALTEEEINFVFRGNLQPLTEPEEGWIYVAGLDLGISKDHAGFAVVGVNKKEKRIRVVLSRDWKPTKPNEEGKKQVDIAVVKDVIESVYKTFSVVWFGYDPAAGGSFLAQDMRLRGVRMREMRFEGVSLNEMALAFTKEVKSGKLESFEHEALRRDFGKFHIVANAMQQYRLKAKSDEHGHADVGTALVICLPKAIELVGGLVPEVSNILAYDDEELTDDDVREIKESDPMLEDILKASTERSESSRGREREARTNFDEFF